MSNHRYRQHQYRHIRHGVPTDADIILVPRGDASPLDPGVPEFPQGLANEDRDQYLRQTPTAHDEDGGGVDEMQAPRCEEAIVLEEERHLHREKADAVEQQAEPVVLPSGFLVSTC